MDGLRIPIYSIMYGVLFRFMLGETFFAKRSVHGSAATLNLMTPCHKQVSLRTSSKPYQLFIEIIPLLGNTASPHE
jgi:hypothetical protein